MKSKLNDKGRYINCKTIEVEGDDCRAVIRIANCEDGYRAIANYDYKTYSIHSPVTQDIEPHSTEREAIASCSFGKDSIATILLALENNEPLDRVVFSEVMFDISRNISGEIPEHIEWIYSTAIPKLEQMGVKVDIVRADTDYMYWFHHIPNGKYKCKKEGFLIGGMCKLNSMCKVRPIEQR